ncbi:MAG: hypothetical protein HS124_06965 [Anaerolineales bacterium]|nr:hypothetical protein [Anaerolineales bacterium]
MESNNSYGRWRNSKRYKDGDTRDKNGRYAGKVVTLRKEHYALIEEWQKRTGMKKAFFWREAIMRGAVDIMKSYGIEAVFPELPEFTKAVPQEPRPKAKELRKSKREVVLDWFIRKISD